MTHISFHKLCARTQKKRCWYPTVDHFFPNSTRTSKATTSLKLQAQEDLRPEAAEAISGREGDPAPWVLAINGLGFPG